LPFRRRQEAIDRATQCDCNACVLIPRLDLKFVAHHGRFGRQRIGGGEELSGWDVILVHRLLKNRVADEIGHLGYALYTDAFVAAMGIDPEALRMRRHGEEVEDIGPVEGWTQDLHERWGEERERRRVKVSREEAAKVLRPAGPSAAGMVVHDRAEHTRDLGPHHQAGRRGDGEWSPRSGNPQPLRPRQGRGPRGDPRLAALRLHTTEVKSPMPLLKPVRIMMELEDTPDGTRVTE
jgi:hypothetical protein